MTEHAETMNRLCWEAFSARFNNAERDELERFPKLKAAWGDWRAAWFAGAEACAKVCDGLYESTGPACDDHPTADDAARAIRDCLN